MERLGNKRVGFQREPTPVSSRGRRRSRENYNRRNNGSRSRSRSFSTPRKNGKKVYFCIYCRRKGHTRKYCYDLKHQKPSIKSVAVVPKKPDLPERLRRAAKSSDSEEDMDVLMISASQRCNTSEPCLIEACVDGETLRMEIDSGSAVSVISKQAYGQRFKDKPLERCNLKLAVVDGARLLVAGRITVLAKVNGRREKLPLVVLESAKEIIPLLGRDWLDIFFPAWRDAFRGPMLVNHTGVSKEDRVVEDIKSKFSKVFDNDFSVPITSFEADLVLKEDKPVFKRAYDVPYRLRDQVVEHIENLEKDGVITPIEASEWASPVVIVVKKDKGIRMVVDCKVSINKLIVPNTYPLPVPQDLFASLSGSKVFCSLDLAGAYTQLRLSKKSRRFMVINTIKGLYSYNRLPQGASSSASIFQKVMDQVLKGLDGVFCYLDDVLIAGKDFEDCESRLYLVLDRLAKFNIKVHLKKCKFFVSSLPYLGHVLTEQGWYLVLKKLRQFVEPSLRITSQS